MLTALSPILVVTRFARETGDVSTLSRNDIKLLALAYTLEVAAHGSAHLTTHAAQVQNTTSAREPVHKSTKQYLFDCIHHTASQIDPSIYSWCWVLLKFLARHSKSPCHLQQPRY